MSTTEIQQRTDVANDFISSLLRDGLLYLDAGQSGAVIQGMGRWVETGEANDWPHFSMVIFSPDGTKVLVQETEVIHRALSADPQVYRNNPQTVLNGSADNWSARPMVRERSNSLGAALVGAQLIDKRGDSSDDQLEMVFLFVAPEDGKFPPGYQMVDYRDAFVFGEVFSQAVIHNAKDVIDASLQRADARETV